MLTNNAIEKIRGSRKCRERLFNEMGITMSTIYRWLDKNDIMLTTAKALTIIIEETGLTQEEILEKEIA